MEHDVKRNVPREPLDIAVLHHACVKMVPCAQRQMDPVTASVAEREFIVKISAPMVIMGKIVQRNVNASKMPYVTG